MYFFLFCVLAPVSKWKQTHSGSEVWHLDRVKKKSSGLKISFTGPSDKMYGDVEFGSDICPMTFSSVLIDRRLFLRRSRGGGSVEISLINVIIK